MWAIILILSSKSNRARLLLGIFMFACFLLFLTHVMYYDVHKEFYLYFDLLFIFCSLSVFPLYYLYIKLLTIESRIHWKDLKLLIPAFVMLAVTSVIYACMSPKLRELYVNNYLFADGRLAGAPVLIQVQKLLTYVLQLFYAFQIIFSAIKIHSFISNYNENIENFYSNLENKTLEWHKMILYSFALTSALSVVYNFLGRSFFAQSEVFLLIPVSTYSILLFMIGLMGNMQNYSISVFEADSFVNPANKEDNLNRKKIKIQLDKLFDKEKIYTNTDLKISDVATQLHTNRTYLSNIINCECSCSFSIFVNQYRVKEAKEVLLNEEYAKYSLEHIAQLSGFGSLHSFIRVFKEIEGITPGRFRESEFHTTHS